MASALTSADNGKTVDMRVGATVVLRLPDNPSTGYVWAVNADPAVVQVSEQKHVSTSNRVGGGGEAQWSIQAKAAGTAKVELKRWREWEGEHSVVERYEVTLAISS